MQAIIRDVGSYGLMVSQVFGDVLRHGVERRELVRQIIKIGVSSIPIVVLTAIFTGMVLALQTAYGLQRFGAKNYVGNIVGLSLVRELGPVLTALMLCGRVGAGIAAELSSMVVTEQVDAMTALGAHPVHKLVTPRVLAGIIVVPLLTVLANVIGMYGGALVAVFELNLTAHQYYRSLVTTLVLKDLFDGLLKSVVFGFLIISIACFKGLHARGGTEGVGHSTTSAVVTGSMVVLIADYFVTQFLIRISQLF